MFVFVTPFHAGGVIVPQIYKKRFHRAFHHFQLNGHKERLHGLDHLRAAAIVLVLIFHYNFYYGVPGWLKTISSFGWSGVDLFFVLSGYLIADKLFRGFDAQGRIDFSGFYLNRSLRIIPAYLVVVALYFYFPVLQEGRGLQPLWKFLTFTQNISIDMYQNTFSHAWSLCVEEHFYLLLPVLLYLVFSVSKMHPAICLFVAVFVFGIVLRYFLWDAFVAPAYGQTRIAAALKHIYYPTYCRLDGLLAGVAIASIFRYRPSVKQKLVNNGNWLLALSILLLVAAFFLFGGSLISQNFTLLPTTVFGFPLVSLAYGLIVIAAMSPRCLLSKYRFWPTSILATLAYSIYLSHKVINHVVNTQFKHFFEPADYLVFPVCLAGAVLCALLLHLIVEKPFLQLRDRLRR